MNINDRADLHLKIVQEISEVVNQSTNLSTILSRVSEIIAHSLHFDVVSIYLWDPSSKLLTLKANIGLNLSPTDPVSLNSGEGLSGFVFETRRPITAWPASKHPRFKAFHNIGEENYECYIGVPIILQDKCLGVLVGQTALRQFLIPAEETLFQVIASRLAGLLEVADRLDRLQEATHEVQQKAVFRGKGVSGGFTVGRIFTFQPQYKSIGKVKCHTNDLELEKSRLESALKLAEKDIQKFIEEVEAEKILSSQELSIFHAHLQIIQDQGFHDAITEKIEGEQITAESAIGLVVESISEQFEKQDDIYLKERAQDFRDIGEKLVKFLVHPSGKEDKSELSFEEGSIFTATSIDPSTLPLLYKNKVGAILTEKGGETSHTAILARSLGIPAVCGIDNLFEIFQPGNKVLVDGKTGFIFLNPHSSLITEYTQSYEKQIHLQKLIRAEGKKSLPNKIAVQLSANVGFPSDLELSTQYDVNQIGLFRTEFSFMQFSKWPKVSEQVESYQKLIQNFKGTIRFRTLDIGGDKDLPYFPFPKEENPLLGLRSIRFSMEYPELFRDQIRAILLTMLKNELSIEILLPMVTYLWEVETAKQILVQTGEELGIKEDQLPPLGLMIEVPSVIYHLDDFKDLIEFISIGTNDLIQYLIAADRNSQTVGHLYTSLHPGVLKALHSILEKSNELGLKASVCGEMAGSVKGALALMAIGFKELSLIPSKIPLIRHLANRATSDLMKTIKGPILSEKNERETQIYLEEVIKKIDPILLEAE